MVFMPSKAPEPPLKSETAVDEEKGASRIRRMPFRVGGRVLGLQICGRLQNRGAVTAVKETGDCAFVLS